MRGERIYSEEFAGKLDEVLGHEFIVEGKDGREQGVVLKDIVDKHLEGFSSPEFSNLSAEEQAEKQREFAMDLGRGISSIPSEDPWSFYFQRIMKNDKINCSGSTALLGMVLENTKEKSGIKSVEFGQPYAHAVNMITFGDDRLYFADAINGEFEDVTDRVKSEEKKELKIYRIEPPKEKNEDRVIFRDIPVSSMKEGIISSYLNNLYSASQSAQGKFDKELRLGRPKEELKEIQKMASEVCEEREISSPGQLQRLRETKNFFDVKLNNYRRSRGFKKEMKRMGKIFK